MESQLLLVSFWVIFLFLLLELGGPARAALYKPLAEQDIDQVSRIVKASERFLRKIALFFAIGIMVFAIVYPFVVLDEFDWFFTFTMVLILGLGTFFQYVFGNAYSMLLQADQKQYVRNIIQIVTVILNTLVAFVLIKMNLDIRIVKLGSSIVFSLNPIVIHYLVKRKYKINDKVIPDDSALKQRWSAFAHRIASFVFSNTDVVIISVFLTLKHVSVYSLYLLIANGLQKIVLSFMSGIEAAFGNMIATKEKSSLKNNLNLSEFLIQSISVPVFATMALLVVPFLKLYTAGVTDINYALPSFGFLVSITFFIFCIRSPYELIVYAAGHYKQTKIGAVVESVLNITLSIALVFPLGLNGIMIGTLVKKGHDVTVITGKPNYGYGKILPDYKNKKYEVINNVKVYRINERPRKKGIISLIFNYFSLYFGTKRSLRKHGHGYDVVLSHVLSPILIATATVKFTRKHNIPHLHYGLDLWPESLITTNVTKRNSLLYKGFYKLSKKLMNIWI